MVPRSFRAGVVTVVAALMAGGWFLGYMPLNQPPSVGDIASDSVASDPSVEGRHSESVSQRALVSASMDQSLSDSDTFKGARPDGRLWTGPGGHLIIDRALRRWFDSWLSLQGEWALDHILVAMQQRIDWLPDPGNVEASELLQQYLAYREALASYDGRTGRSLAQADVATLAQRLDWVERVRRQFFNEEVIHAFFRDDETLDRHFLARRQWQQDGRSSEALQSLAEALPPALKTAREQAQSLLRLKQLEAQWQEAGQTMGVDAVRQQKYDARAAQWGEAAASRLALLDKQQQNWQQRIEAYRAFRDQSLNGLEESEITEEVQRALDRWLTDHFSEQERRRVAAALVLYQSQRNSK